jgi:Leucine carboxyl methyltransferase
MKALIVVLSLLCTTVRAEAFVGAGEPPRERRVWQRWMLNGPLSSTASKLERRGQNYGQFNSTILAARDVAAVLGVEPPDDVSAAAWKRAYTIQKYATPVLHLFDRQKPPNSSLNLYCIWWKAISGNDVNSPVYDQRLSFDLLPRGTRWILQRPQLFPRLHHANVEIRTAFLDRAVTRCALEHRSESRSIGEAIPTKIRLVSLGAGYDVRSIKIKERGTIDRAYELDLPDVVSAKRKILESKRFRQRRPHTVQESMPTAYPVDLNDVEAVRAILLEILQSERGTGENEERWHTIFLFEAVMIYLNDGVPRALLHLCSEVLEATKQSGSLCFADRLENVPGGDYESASREMNDAGWTLVEWLPKPGLARHMGRAAQHKRVDLSDTSS